MTRLFLAMAFTAVAMFAQTIPDALKGADRAQYILDNAGKLPDNAFERFLDEEIAQGRVRKETRTAIISDARLYVQARLDFGNRYRVSLSADGVALEAREYQLRAGRFNEKKDHDTRVIEEMENLVHTDNRGNTTVLQIFGRSVRDPSETYGNPLLRPVPGGVTYAPYGIKRRNELDPPPERQGIFRKVWNAVR